MPVSSMPVALETPAWRVGGEYQRVNAPLTPAAEPSLLNFGPQKPQFTVARETARVMNFKMKGNNARILDRKMAI